MEEAGQIPSVWLPLVAREGCPALAVAVPSPDRASCSQQWLGRSSSRRHLWPERRHDDETVQNEDWAVRLAGAEAVVVALVGARWPWKARP